MFDVHVLLKSSPDGSAAAELVNREDLMAELQQTIAGEIHEEHGPAFKPYNSKEPEYAEDPPEVPTLAGFPIRKPEIEHMKAQFPEDERSRLRSVGRVPREIQIPADGMKLGFTEEIIKGALEKLVPACRRLGIRVVIVP